MPITIASWNIEKNGQSSTLEKQSKVSEFIDSCCGNGVTVVFLCEVHSARIDDYVTFLQEVYGNNYHIASLPGGLSNAYVILIRKDAGIVTGQDGLRNLDRGAIVLQIKDLFVMLAHFKSGQTGLTQNQIQEAARFLNGVSGNSGRWAIIGDMNWEYTNVQALSLPQGTQAYVCGQLKTQTRGGILDWCLAGNATEVQPGLSIITKFPPQINDMQGPDHRPVVFTVS
jgi:hypothetical protein